MLEPIFHLPNLLNKNYICQFKSKKTSSEAGFFKAALII